MAENEKKHWHDKWQNTKSKGSAGDFTYFGKAEKASYLADKIKSIIDRLISIKEDIKATVVAETNFSGKFGSVANFPTNNPIYDNARAWSLI